MSIDSFRSPRITAAIERTVAKMNFGSQLFFERQLRR
jgi:hypothetical protein